MPDLRSLLALLCKVRQNGRVARQARQLTKNRNRLRSSSSSLVIDISAVLYAFLRSIALQDLEHTFNMVHVIDRPCTALTHTYTWNSKWRPQTLKYSTALKLIVLRISTELQILCSCFPVTPSFSFVWDATKLKVLSTGRVASKRGIRHLFRHSRKRGVGFQLRWSLQERKLQVLPVWSLPLWIGSRRSEFSSINQLQTIMTNISWHLACPKTGAPVLEKSTMTTVGTVASF